MNILHISYVHLALVVAAIIIFIVAWLVSPNQPRWHKFVVAAFFLLALAFFFTGCSVWNNYNSHVAAREDSLSGYSKDGRAGGTFSHRVEYR